jgi:hypothetical protein
MSKLVRYRKLFGVEKSASLQELKTIYRSFMKEWHPDKFQDDAEQLKAAELKSKSYIEAYHFLVSISPETVAENLPSYTATITDAAIADINYKGDTLQISFDDGNSFEYYEVPRNVYVKLVNADTQGRFARRHICSSYTYRNVSKMMATAE